MGYAKIRPRRGTLEQWENANPILQAGELVVIVPDAGIGTGLCSFKQGDGVTNFHNLPFAINIDISDNEVRTFDAITDDNPILLPGDKESTLWSKAKKKFTFLSNIIGNVAELAISLGKTDTQDMANLIKYVNEIKINKNLLYNGLDSTNPNQFLAAMAGKTLKQTDDNLQSQITQVNGDLGSFKLIEKYNAGASILTLTTQKSLIPDDAAYMIIVKWPLNSTQANPPFIILLYTRANSIFYQIIGARNPVTNIQFTNDFRLTVDFSLAIWPVLVIFRVA